MRNVRFLTHGKEHADNVCINWVNDLQWGPSDGNADPVADRPRRKVQGKATIMDIKNIINGFASYCADNMFPENIAREKKAEVARRYASR